MTNISMRNEIKDMQKYYIYVRVGSDSLLGREAFYFKTFNLLLFQTSRGRYFLRVLFYLAMVDEMWQRIVDSFDVVGCN